MEAFAVEEVFSEESEIIDRFMLYSPSSICLTDSMRPKAK
jgi:hypothetical protein